MAITVKHKFVSAIPDGDDATIVRPSNWNDTHELTGLGTLAEQNANAVAITGGTITGTSIPAADVTGLGTMATQNANNVSITGGSIAGATVSGYIPTSEKAQPLGVATLDASGKVPTSQIPLQGDLNYQGTWNATTNTPTLTSSVGTKGYYYVVDVAGTTNLNGITDWQIGDWAIFNGTVWQKVDNTDAVTSVNGKTGTVVLNATDVGAVSSVSGTAPVSVATGTTTPVISLASGYGDTQNPYASKTAKYVLAAPNATAGVPTFRQLANTDISGLGTMSTQNASSVAITGGAINGVAIGGTTAGDGTFDILTANVSRIHTATADSLTIGTLSYTPANALISSQSSVATYNQVILQNSNTGATASADFIVNNSNSTDSTYYGDFGMNSNGFTGTGAFNQPNTVYLTGTTADLAIGTTTSNSIHFVVAGGATDAMTINTTKSIAFNGSYGTAGQVLTSGGSTGVPTWTTPTTGTVTSVSGTTGRITSTGGTTPVIDLASGIATAGTTGSSTLIPVVTIDTYGRVTGITTASNPQGTVTSVTGTAPVVSSGGATPAISMAAATGSVNGYLTSTDWTTFNSKAPAVTYTSTYVPYGQGTTTPNQSSSFTFDGTALTAPRVNATVSVAASGTQGAINYGTLSYSDTNHLATFQTSVNSYSQVEIQNTNAGASASADMIVGNNNTTSSTYYGDFGMNSGGWAGTGAFNSPNNVYLTATSGDLAIGTTTSNQIRFAVNGGTTDALTIATTGAVTTPNQLTGATVRASNGIVVNSKTISASYSIASGDNAMSVGPVTVATGQTVTVASGSRWVVL